MKRTVSLILAVAICATFFCMAAPSALAAKSGVFCNCSYSPATVNASVADLPEAIGTACKGDTIYLNVAATTDYQLSKVEVYARPNGNSSYSLVGEDTARNFFRYTNLKYTCPNATSVDFIFKAYLTNGCCGEGQYTLKLSNRAVTNSSNHSFQYNGFSFHTVPNFSTKYAYNQKDYSRFVNWAGRNTGCTATAMCIAYSIYHDSALSPNSVGWYSYGTAWEYCNRYSESGRIFIGDTYSQREALKAAYNCICSGRPLILGVFGSGNDHVVVAVGIRDGASYANLSMCDFLIIDPNGGGIATLNRYRSIDTEWDLQVPY